MKLPSTIVQRRDRTDEKLQRLVRALQGCDAETIVGNYACVYATGSLGRGELSDRSDLDLFVLRDRCQTPHLSNLDEIRLKARLIEVARRECYPEFSGDGKYIEAHDL